MRPAMRRETLLRSLGLVLALTLAACAAYRAQHAGAPASRPARAAAATVAVEAPGAEFTELSQARQLARVRGEVESLKAERARSGHYDCCVEPPCTECLLKHGECHCRETVRHRGPCCGECVEGWAEGRGAVERVQACALPERKSGGEKPPQEQPQHPHHHH